MRLVGPIQKQADQSFHIQYVPPSWEDGCPVAAPPAAVFKIEENNWNHILVGKVIDDSPSFSAFKLFVAKVWKKFGHIVVSTSVDGLALFKFQDATTGLNVLKRP